MKLPSKYLYLRFYPQRFVVLNLRQQASYWNSDFAEVITVQHAESKRLCILRHRWVTVLFLPPRLRKHHSKGSGKNARAGRWGGMLGNAVFLTCVTWLLYTSTQKWRYLHETCTKLSQLKTQTWQRKVHLGTPPYLMSCCRLTDVTKWRVTSLRGWPLAESWYTSQLLTCGQHSLNSVDYRDVKIEQGLC